MPINRMDWCLFIESAVPSIEYSIAEKKYKLEQYQQKSTVILIRVCVRVCARLINTFRFFPKSDTSILIHCISFTVQSLFFDCIKITYLKAFPFWAFFFSFNKLKRVQILQNTRLQCLCFFARRHPVNGRMLSHKQNQRQNRPEIVVYWISFCSAKVMIWPEQKETRLKCRYCT